MASQKPEQKDLKFLKRFFMSLLSVKCVNTLRNVMAVINESFLCKYKFYIKNFQFIPSLLFVLGQEAGSDPYGES